MVCSMAAWPAAETSMMDRDRSTLTKCNQGNISHEHVTVSNELYKRKIGTNLKHKDERATTNKVSVPHNASAGVKRW